MEWAYWHALNAASGLGVRRIIALIEHFGNARAVWMAKPEEWRQVAGIPGSLVDTLVTHQMHWSVEGEAERLIQAGVQVLTLADPNYPALLGSIYDPPPVLYFRGSMKFEELSMGVVGSRKVTAYGRMVTESLVAELGDAGITIVSGLARGVDTIAHRSALKVRARTVAVLGSGIDVIYPPENRQLFEEISSTGAVLTAYPLGVQPDAGHFPARNRIISGLSRGVLVVEAAERSGSLITASFALEQGRDVFAVPGNVNSLYSQGTNLLIKDGACLVSSAKDVFEEWHMAGQTAVASSLPIAVSAIEEQILEGIPDGMASLEDILERVDASPSEIQAGLTLLEIRGMVVRGVGPNFIRRT